MKRQVLSSIIAIRQCVYGGGLQYLKGRRGEIGEGLAEGVVGLWGK